MKKVFILLLLACVGIASVVGLSIVQRRIPSSGTVYVVTLGIDVFWDETCTNAIAEIVWGTLEPGDVVSKTIYVKNSGNAAVVLSMVAENWLPIEAGNFISITWDAEESILSAGGVKMANLTMNVSSSIAGITDFSVDISIQGAET